MTPPAFDPMEFRAMFPDAPGWGIYLAGRLYDLKAEIAAKAAWTVQDIAIIAGAVTATIAALKGGGVV